MNTRKWSHNEYFIHIVQERYGLGNFIIWILLLVVVYYYYCYYYELEVAYAVYCHLVIHTFYMYTSMTPRCCDEMAFIRFWACCCCCCCRCCRKSIHRNSQKHTTLALCIIDTHTHQHTHTHSRWKKKFCASWEDLAEFDSSTCEN